MNARHSWVTRTAWVLAVALCMVSRPSRAIPPWQGLPPTPELPQHTMGRFMAIHGARIWYAEWGQKAQGVPVLLLHGGLGNSSYFGNLIPFLVGKGYRVVAIDSRGHGRSTGSKAPQTYHLMAEDVVTLLDALHIQRVRLVGWSDGGCTGLDLAINHPKRLKGLFTFGANSVVSGEIDGGAKTPVFAAYLVRVRDEYRFCHRHPINGPASRLR